MRAERLPLEEEEPEDCGVGNLAEHPPLVLGVPSEAAELLACWLPVDADVLDAAFFAPPCMISIGC